MKRGTYQSVVERNQPILKRISALKAEHPYWGYRRIHAYLRHYDGLKISANRVYRIMHRSNLLVSNRKRLKAKRVETSKPIAAKPNQWWGIDMTKVMIDGFGWQYVVIVIDWYTKKVVGHYCGTRSKTEHWLQALDDGLNQQFPQGAKHSGLQLMSDNGCQPTSVGFMKACGLVGVKQAFTSYNNPKGNAETERFMRTMKEELVWINEWKSPLVFQQALANWIDEYNHHYLHSALGYLPPVTFEQNTLKNVA